MPQGAEHDCISPATSQKEARLSSKHMATESIRSTSDALSTREGDRKNSTKDACKLHRFPLTLWLTVTYAILSIFAWTINCTLVRKPLNASHYGMAAMLSYRAATDNPQDCTSEMATCTAIATPLTLFTRSTSEFYRLHGSFKRSLLCLLYL